MASSLYRSAVLLLALLLLACGAPGPSQSTTPHPAAQVAVAPPEQLPGSLAAEQEGGDPGPIPVTQADPAWGSRFAPVTIVEFSDFECPFCARAASTLSALRRIYGPDRLRIVWKNDPLPFHKAARPAAEAAMAVYQVAGADGFWAYHDTIFSAEALDGETIGAAVASSVRVSPGDVARLIQSGTPSRKVDGDLDLAKALGVTGTPAFFINGIFLSGAQPLDRFREIIDLELVASSATLAGGMPASHLYAARVVKNFLPAAEDDPPEDEQEEEEKEDTTAYRVPIDGSPFRGKPGALVTLVMFSDYQCPFCVRAHSTVRELEARYGEKLRVVIKHNPLPFHPRAEPAAELALEARAQKGDQAFWKVNDLLFDTGGKLEDRDLETIAQQSGLHVPSAMRAVAARKHSAKIEVDQELSDDLNARGTPHFFINGRRLAGAQPLEVFQRLIDAQLAEAQALLSKGVAAAAVYATLQKNAVGPALPPKVTVPAPTRDNPARGASRAKVTVQIFSDFQCPFCKVVEPTLTALDASFPGQIRFVWRNLPLPMHPQAQIAAEAALEAFKQKGATGFWQMHDRIFQNQTASGLDRAALGQHAAALNLDLARFTAALDGRVHSAAVESDKQIAELAGVHGTPGFVINGYFLSGAQPLAKFKKIVRLALSEAK
jgi:protein-disulfide isomerase